MANREVEISRVPGAPVGQRTNIRIDALRRSDNGTAFDVITAVIETKGCWNAELFRALEAQLYHDYMMRLQVLGWFDKPKWDTTDARRRRAPNCTLLETQARLDAQAQAIPAEFSVQALVLDCHAP
jgi:hypothetical protein